MEQISELSTGLLVQSKAKKALVKNSENFLAEIRASRPCSLWSLHVMAMHGYCATFQRLPKEALIK